MYVPSWDIKAVKGIQAVFGRIDFVPSRMIL
jgi:hypothetical protein